MGADWLAHEDVRRDEDEEGTDDEHEQHHP